MSMSEIVAADIGGTHARFAIARIADGRVVDMDEPVTLKTADHASFQTAWEHFGEILGRDLPRGTGIAVAGPVTGEVLKFTNNPWVIRPALVNEKLKVDHHVIVNDFGAIGHAVAQLPSDQFQHLFGPEQALPGDGVISIIGPGTGLGVAHVLRRQGGYHVQATEGGHIDFAPLDKIEDSILAHLRRKYRRVSVERVVCGPGLVNIHEALAAIEGRAVAVSDDKTLWASAMEGSDSLASAALDRFCLSFGSVAGDIALAQGGSAVVIAGGLGLRLADHLPRSGFHERFVAKGRFEGLMSTIPVKLITHPQPGLFGAAAAYAEKYAS